MTQLLHLAAACAVLAAAPGDSDADVVRARSAWHDCVRAGSVEKCSDYERTFTTVYHLLGVRPSQIREIVADNKRYLRCGS